jgi:hypothetical protein
VRATSHRIAGLIQGVMVSAHEIRILLTSRRTQRVALVCVDAEAIARDQDDEGEQL